MLTPHDSLMTVYLLGMLVQLSNYMHIFKFLFWYSHLLFQTDVLL